jgi:hypothetical protein
MRLLEQGQMRLVAQYSIHSFLNLSGKKKRIKFSIIQIPTGASEEHRATYTFLPEDRRE